MKGKLSFKRKATSKKKPPQKPLFFLIPLALIALFFGLKIAKERHQLKQTPPPTPQQAPKQRETPEERIHKLEEKLKKHPQNIPLILDLARLYESQGNIPRAFLLYRRILKLSPRSSEGEQAKRWLDQKFSQAKSAWKEGLGQKFQQVSQAGYESLTLPLASIAKKVEEKQKKASEERKKTEEETAQQKTEAQKKAAEKKTSEPSPSIYILSPVTSTAKTSP